MSHKPIIRIWVLQTGWIYSIRTCHKWGSHYYLSHNHKIPFCTSYVEFLDSFLERHPALRSPILEAMHDYYNYNQGLVDFHQQGYKYET